MFHQKLNTLFTVFSVNVYNTNSKGRTSKHNILFQNKLAKIKENIYFRKNVMAPFKLNNISHLNQISTPATPEPT